MLIIPIKKADLIDIALVKFVDIRFDFQSFIRLFDEGNSKLSLFHEREFYYSISARFGSQFSGTYPTFTVHSFWIGLNRVNELFIRIVYEHERVSFLGRHERRGNFRSVWLILPSQCGGYVRCPWLFYLSFYTTLSVSLSFWQLVSNPFHPHLIDHPSSCSSWTSIIYSWIV